MADVFRRIFRSPVFLLAAFSIVLHSGSLRNGFVYDDVILVSENDFVHSLENLPKVFTREYLTDRQEIERPAESPIGSGESTYRPVRTLFFFLFFRLFGLWAPGWHFTSLLAHALDVCLIYLLCRRLGAGFEGSYFAAFLFAAHPAVVESVHAVSFDADLIGLAFVLGSIFAYLDFREKRKKGSYAISIGLYLLGCFTKETACVLPAFILLHDLCFGGERDLRDLWKRRAVYGGYFVALLTYLWVRFALIYDPATPIEYPGGRWYGVIAVLGRYLAAAVFPLDVHLTIPGDPGLMDPDWRGPVFVASAAVVALVLGAAWGVRKRRPWLSFGIFWFFAGLLPLSKLLVGFMAYRYLYIPLAGFAVAAAFAFTEVLADARREKAAQSVFIVLLAFFCFLTAWAGRPWRSNDSLFRDMKAHYPYLAQPHSYLAGRLFMEGRFEEAAAEFEESIRIDPTYAKDYIFLGLCRQWADRHEEALAAYRKALTLDPSSPEAHIYIGLLTAEPEKKLAHYRQALRLDPRSFLAWNALGIFYAQKGEFEKAERSWEKALRLKPGFALAAQNLKALELMRKEGSAPPAKP